MDTEVKANHSHYMALYQMGRFYNHWVECRCFSTPKHSQNQYRPGDVRQDAPLLPDFVAALVATMLDAVEAGIGHSNGRIDPFSTR